MGLMQFWRPPSNDREVLMLIRSPRPIGTQDFFHSDAVKSSLHDVSVEQQQTITICKNQKATFVRARGSSSRGGDESVEMIATNAGSNSYFAMYIRPLGAAPTAAAQAALREVCTKS